MGAFRYRALDAGGVERSGLIDADSNRHARSQLRERGLFPVDIEAAAGTTSAARRHLSTAELCLMTRQFGALLGSGLTVEQALAALADQAERPGTRQILAGVRGEVVAGHSLRSALERYGRVFPPVYLASVAAGEKSGQLAEVVSQLADYLEAQDGLRRKTLQSLLYPAIVFVIAVLVVVGLMTYVVPQIVEVFRQGKQALPLLTRIMIFASDMLRQWGWVFVLVLVGGGIAFKQALRDDTIRRRWDTWLLGLPLLGRHLRAIDTARFSGTLAILVGSGVPLLAALDAGRQVIARLPMRQAVALAADRVREGVSLSTALRQTQAFPPLLTHMIASGEATGELETMLVRTARLQQNEVEQRTATLTTLLEPLLLVAMGGTVLLIVLAVMQPIIEVNTLLK
ncbi:MAG: type II secretion system inner membrane protein GspF [Moraxellaceae bacterium]|nr:type II secretion system inner membrane protein GspF [Moraxellaceae bacterium]